MTAISYSDSTQPVTFTYDRGRRQETITDAAGSHTLTHITAGQLLSDQISGGLLDQVTPNWGCQSGGLTSWAPLPRPPEENKPHAQLGGRDGHQTLTPTRTRLADTLKADRNHRITFYYQLGMRSSAQFHLMPDEFHFMPDKFHLMPDPTKNTMWVPS
jgi:hypothetical protein